MKRIIVGVSGASGPIYAIRLLQALRRRPDIETHLILSQAAHLTLKLECPDWSLDAVQALAHTHYRARDLTAPIASGSYPTTAMVVVPASMKTVAQIAHGVGETLLHRAADVTLKESRPLIVVPRESPLHLGHLRNLTTLAELGTRIVMPVIAFYQHPQTLDQAIDHTVGKILETLALDHELYSPWSGPPAL